MENYSVFLILTSVINGIAECCQLNVELFGQLLLGLGVVSGLFGIMIHGTRIWSLASSLRLVLSTLKLFVFQHRTRTQKSSTCTVSSHTLTNHIRCVSSYLNWGKQQPKHWR